MPSGLMGTIVIVAIGLVVYHLVRDRADALIPKI